MEVQISNDQADSIVLQSLIDTRNMMINSIDRLESMNKLKAHEIKDLIQYTLLKPHIEHAIAWYCAPSKLKELGIIL